MSLSLDDCLNDRRGRQVIERDLEIIGEAPRRIEKINPITAGQSTDHWQTIGLRNRLIDGYDETDDSTIWTIITTFLPILAMESRRFYPRQISPPSRSRRRTETDHLGRRHLCQDVDDGDGPCGVVVRQSAPVSDGIPSGCWAGNRSSWSAGWVAR